MCTCVSPCMYVCVRAYLHVCMCVIYVYKHVIILGLDLIPNVLQININK